MGVDGQPHLPATLLPGRVHGTHCTISSVGPMRTTIPFNLDFEMQILKTVSVLYERDINIPGFEPGLSTDYNSI
jgi:hypothetical protein